MLTPYLPFPPSSGGQIRSYNLIKHLAKRHTIHLVALIKSKEEERYAKDLKRYCGSVHLCYRSEKPWTISNVSKSIFGKWPFLVIRNFSPEAKKVMKGLIKQYDFDVIHAETFYVMPHIPETSIPILLVDQTIEYRVYQHFVNSIKIPLLPQFLSFEIMKLKHWEKDYWDKADIVGAVSEDDKQEMLALDPKLTVKVIPNAAGEDLFNLYNPNKKSMKPNFLFTGNYTWIQNVEAAELLAKNVFPEILHYLPDAQCYIVGQHAKDKISHCQSKNIHIIDIASSDVRSIHTMFKKNSVFISTLEGPGGTRLKILGAMASGLPVICSPTSIGGLNVKDGKHVLVAKSPKEFAQKARMLFETPHFYERIRRDARKLIEENYEWSQIAENLEKIYKTMVAKKS